MNGVAFLLVVLGGINGVNAQRRSQDGAVSFTSEGPGRELVDRGPPGRLRAPRETPRRLAEPDAVARAAFPGDAGGAVQGDGKNGKRVGGNDWPGHEHFMRSHGLLKEREVAKRLRRHSNESLEELIASSGSDKARKGNGNGYHGYTRYYERIFKPLRTEAVRLVEIGVERGRSMKAWQQYFTNAEHVYGIGYGNFQTETSQACSSNTATKVKSRVPCTIYKGDQSDILFLNHFVAETGGLFDIIIDDGSHVPNHQLISFENLWPSVKPGGMYIVEDIETNWWKPFSSVCKTNLQPDFNVRVLECFDTITSAVLRELAESNRFVQKSAESTSI